MRSPCRRLVATLALVAAVGLAACDQPVTVVPTADVTVAPAQPFDPMDPACTGSRAERVAANLPPCGVQLPVDDGTGDEIFGDSITWQLFMSAGVGHPAYGMMGWRADDVLPYARTTVPARRVILFGTNDAGLPDGGWNDADVARWTALLDLPTGCTAVVLPWVIPPASYAHLAEMQEARDWLTQAAAARGFPVVDWQAAAATPGVLAPGDGIHLDYAAGGNMAYDVTPVAAAARRAVIEEALAACAA